MAHPLSGPFVRQTWGRCVFLDASGCRLHAVFGPDAKPRVCATFPRLPGGDVDPACFHDGARGSAPDPGILAELQDLSHGERARAALDLLPLAAILDGPGMGPQTTELLRALGAARPAIPRGDAEGRLIARIAVARRHALIDGPTERVQGWLVGGAQLTCGAGVPDGAGFAAWTRLLRTGALKHDEPARP